MFWFARIEHGLRRAGTYRLEYEMSPAVPGRPALTLAVELLVAVGPAVGFEIQARLPWISPRRRVVRGRSCGRLRSDWACESAHACSVGLPCSEQGSAPAVTVICSCMLAVWPLKWCYHGGQP